MSQTLTVPQTQTTTKPTTKQPRLWNVVLVDDQDHSYEYVMQMTMSLFAHPVERAFLIAQKVDTHGRAILGTYHRELAELKQEQVHSFGRDAAIASCQGSMTCVLEPADFGDDDEDE